MIEYETPEGRFLSLWKKVKTDNSEYTAILEDNTEISWNRFIMEINNKIYFYYNNIKTGSAKAKNIVNIIRN